MNLRVMSIGARLGIGFGVILTILICVLVIGRVISSRVVDQITIGMTAANTKVVLVTKMKSTMQEGATAMRNVALQPDVAEIQKEEAKVKAKRNEYELAREQFVAAGLSDEEKTVLSDISAMDKDTVIFMKEAVSFALAFNNDGAAKVFVTKIDPIYQKQVALIDKLMNAQQASVSQIIEDTESSSKSSRNLLIFLGISTLFLAGGIALIITRSITIPLRDAVVIAKMVASGDLNSKVEVTGHDEISQLISALKEMNESLATTVDQVRTASDTINVASSEIASGNADLSSRTESQASSLEETAASMAALTTTVKQNADNARQANQLVFSASDFAVKGGAVVGHVIETMGSIKESSRKIVDIISVIDGIAFQTNILALNAAVEAARAGEQGRGFAVVATEVRNLAQRSAGAAKEIKTLIGDSVGKVDEGSKLVDEAGQTMGQIVESVRRVADIMSEITAASVEQGSGIEEVNESIAQMDEMTQQNAALVEQAAATAASMQDQASMLSRAVSVFKFDAGISTASQSKKLPVPTIAKLIKSASPAITVAKNKVPAQRVKQKNANAMNGDDWEEF